jgi:hypothetical protein
VAAVQKLGGTFGDESCLSRCVHQSLEEGTFESPIEQLPAKTAQNGGVETLISEPHPQSMLPSQIESHSLLGLGVGAVVVVLKEHGEHHHRGRYARAAFRRIFVERGVVLVVN